MLIDISVPLAATTPPWPGDQRFHCGWTLRTEQGESVNLAAITTSFHVGTHADAPLHVEASWPASEHFALDAFVGDAMVVHLPTSLPEAQVIDLATLRTLVGERPVPRLLVRTAVSVADGAFPDQWPVLSSAAAEWLVAQGVQLVGVDAPSVDARESKSLPVHHALLGAGVYVLENLDLRAVAAGHYELVALPLKVTGADAAPVRAALRKRSTEHGIRSTEHG